LTQPGATPSGLIVVPATSEADAVRADDLKWSNEPQAWRPTSSGLEISVEPKTDFWRTTHYGFVRDNGHFGGMKVSGDFALSGFLRAGLRDQYDQLGLMLRIDEEHWIKCGLERVDGENFLSVVLTRQYSDWSLRPLSVSTKDSWQGIKLVRTGPDVEVSVLTPEGQTTPFRVGRLGFADELLAGVTAAAPEGQGFTAEFSELALRRIGIE
jgi:regulation of enolase protein 1 (concanavalin A-like superfamily)